MLASKCATWVQLPHELWPASWKGKYSKPMVLLVKSLYGHPEAGTHWDRHLEKILDQMGGTVIPEFPSSYFFQKESLLLTVYVDDSTLSGPVENHAAFWLRLRKDFELEKEGGLERILGRHHDELTIENKAYLAFNMEDYAMQACELFGTVSGGNS